MVHKIEVEKCNVQLVSPKNVIAKGWYGDNDAYNIPKLFFFSFSLATKVVLCLQITAKTQYSKLMNVNLPSFKLALIKENSTILAAFNQLETILGDV